VERQYVAMPRFQPSDEASWHELRAILDEELDALPEKYRGPLVLCGLEGKTHQEAARELSCPRTSLSSRLSRARTLLRQRLMRRGVTLSTAALAAILTENASATVPALLTIATVRVATAKAAMSISESVAQLAEEGIKSMSLGQLKAVLVLLLVTSLAAAGSAIIAYSPQEKTQTVGVQSGPKIGDKTNPGKAEEPKVDRQGDPLPPGAVARMGTTRFRHGDAVYEVAFTPDGSRLISTDWKSIHVWEAAAGKEVRRIDTALRSMTLSRDGKRVATSEHNQGLIQVWDLASGDVVRGFKNGPDLDDRFCSVHFSPDGKLLASFGNKRIRLWDASSSEKLREWIADAESIHCLLFTSDSKTILSGGDDKSIHFWDVATGKELRRIDGHPGTVNHLALTADGKILATVGATKHERKTPPLVATSWWPDNKVHLWDLSTGKKVRQLEAKDETDLQQKQGLFSSNAIHHLAFSPDGKTLTTTGQDRTIRIWDAPAGKELRRWDSFWISSLAFSADGKILASGGVDRTIRLWDPATGKELREQPGHRDGVQFITFSPDGRRLATATSDRTVRVWSTTTGEEVLRLNGPQGELRPLGFSANSRTLTTIGASMTAQGADKKLRVWDLATGKQIHTSDASIEGSVCTASPVGRTWAIAWYDKSVSFWDAVVGQWRPTKIKHIDGIYALGFAADGRSLFTWCGDKRVHVWEVSSGKETRQFSFGQQSDTQKVAFSPNGRWIAHTSDDEMIRLYDAATVKEVHRLPGVTGRWLSCMSFSPDSRTLAASGTNELAILLWEVATGKPRGQFTGHQGRIYTLVFAPDCKHLASGADDTTALLWDLSLIAKSSSGTLHRRTDLAAGWEDLASEDGKKAYHALWSLAAMPEETIAFLKDRLQAVTPDDAKRIEQLIGQLDSDDFGVRERATRELEKLEGTVEETLRQAIEQSASTEVRTRAKAILVKLDPSLSPALVRQLRAVELLERIGTPSARRLLATVASGAAGARPTREAKAALERLTQRSTP
jgi:WD40 repeat protein